MGELTSDDWKDLQLPKGIEKVLRKWSSETGMSSNELVPSQTPNSTTSADRSTQSKASPEVSSNKPEDIDTNSCTTSQKTVDISSYVPNCLAILVWWKGEEISFAHSIKTVVSTKHFSPVQYCIAHSEKEVYFCFNFETPLNFIRQKTGENIGNILFFISSYTEKIIDI